MTPSRAKSELAEALHQAGLDPEALDPWPAWKVFKSFLRRELEGGYDAAGVQVARSSDQPGCCSLSLVRQASERDSEGEDIPFWALSVVFEYESPALVRNLDELDVWSFEFRSLEEFASVVEGTSAFQRLVAASPKASLILEEGPDEAVF